MNIHVQGLLAVVLVILVIVSPPQISPSNTAVTVKIRNPTSSSVGLCWLSSYARENELIKNAPDGCYQIGVGEKNTFTLKTYTGHRFILLPWEKEITSHPQSRVAAGVASGGDADAQSIPTMFLYIKPNVHQYEVEFNKTSLGILAEIASPDDAWQLLLRNRHYFMILLVSLYFLAQKLADYPSSSSSESMRVSHRLGKTAKKGVVDVTESDVKKNSPPALMIPRHSLKCFAVLNMILNHISYLIFKSNSTWQFLGTLPADLIGSSQIFWFLVGYQHASTRKERSDSSKLLVVFCLLEHFCRLPRPITYETLLTVVVARSLLSSDVFLMDESTKCCLFAQLPVLLHSVCCCALIAINDLFNGSGLRLLQCTGLMYAVAGKLFMSSHREAPLEARAAHFTWLLAACGLQFKLVWISKLNSIDINSVEGRVACVCVLGAVCQAVLFAVPTKAPAWSSSSVAVWISRHSLEIYCAHLVLLWSQYGS